MEKFKLSSNEYNRLYSLSKTPNEFLLNIEKEGLDKFVDFIPMPFKGFQFITCNSINVQKSTASSNINIYTPATAIASYVTLYSIHYLQANNIDRYNSVEMCKEFYLENFIKSGDTLIFLGELVEFVSATVAEKTKQLETAKA
jgi:hypothetical protein